MFVVLWPRIILMALSKKFRCTRGLQTWIDILVRHCEGKPGFHTCVHWNWYRQSVNPHRVPISDQQFAERVSHTQKSRNHVKCSPLEGIIKMNKRPHSLRAPVSTTGTMICNPFATYKKHFLGSCIKLTRTTPLLSSSVSDKIFPSSWAFCSSAGENEGPCSSKLGL